MSDPNFYDDSYEAYRNNKYKEDIDYLKKNQVPNTIIYVGGVSDPVSPPPTNEAGNTVTTMIEPVTQDDTFTGIANGVDLDMAALSYEEISIQIVSVGTGTATLVFEGTNNDSSYTEIESFAITNAVDVTYAYRANFRKTRTRVSAYAGLDSVDTFQRATV